MDTKKRSPIRWIYAAGALGASVAFFVSSLHLAWRARQYQISGQPMPNGKAGFMTYGDGYLLAIVLFLFSVAFVIVARRFIRAR
jgi:hypothetical protein